MLITDMKYASGSIGRVFVVRFDHKDDVYQGLKSVVRNEGVRFASVSLIGALRSGRVVTGPKYNDLPPDPDWKFFGNTHEIIGSGTIVNNGDTFFPHIHVSIGRGGKVFTGCLRGTTEVFLTVEAVITELIGIDAVREYSQEIKQKLLDIK